MNRPVISFCMLIAASLSMPTQPALACTHEAAKSVGRYLDRERKKRIKVEGTLRVASSFMITRPDDFDKDDSIEETWHFARIETKDGSVYSTYHNTDNVIILCGRAQGPVRDAQGVFYLQENREDGNFYIYDWEGTYLPTGTKYK